MTFKQARKAVYSLVTSIFVTALFGYVLPDSMTVPFIVIIVSLFVALFYITIMFFKCPHCGAGFSFRFPFTATHCPFCGEKLE